MGQTLIRMVRDEDGMRLVGATERPGSASVGLDVGLAIRQGALEVALTDDLRKAVTGTGAQVVIDFTSVEASVQHARICAEKGLALVVGSTGFSPEAKAEISRCAQSIPVVMAPNMSVGVNLVIKVAGELAKVLGPGFDVEIVETHHRLKKDAPSGTALRLAEEIAKVLDRKAEDIQTERSGNIGERPAGQIGVQSVRGGDVVGEHTVFFFGEGERVELSHRATSRDQFARGAVRAAKWAAGRAPGLYDMQDVLGLR